MDRAALCALIPHGGSMCLLDGVAYWDEERIRCHSHTHLAADNPLRADGRLGAIHALEYGAQAMAVHSGLLARGHGGRLRPGLLAGLRDVRLHVARLDRTEAPLWVEAQRLMGAGDSFVYRIDVRLGADPAASARATVIVPGRQL